MPLFHMRLFWYRGWPAHDASEIATQEGRLVGALEQMGRRIEGFREGIRALAADLGEDAGGLLSALDRLEVLSVPG